MITKKKGRVTPKTTVFAALPLEVRTEYQSELERAAKFVSTLPFVINHIDGTRFNSDAIARLYRSNFNNERLTLHLYRWFITMAISNGMPASSPINEIETWTSSLAKHKAYIDGCNTEEVFPSGMMAPRETYEEALIELEAGEFSAYNALQHSAEFCTNLRALPEANNECPNELTLPTIALAGLILFGVCRCFTSRPQNKASNNKVDKTETVKEQFSFQALNQGIGNRTDSSVLTPKLEETSKPLTPKTPIAKHPNYGKKRKSQQRQDMLKMSNAYGPSFFVSKKERKRLAEDKQRETFTTKFFGLTPRRTGDFVQPHRATIRH